MRGEIITFKMFSVNLRSLRQFSLNIALFFVVLGNITSAYAADAYLTGTMSNITAGRDGLLIMLDMEVPANCAGIPYGWMMIRESNKAMIAVALVAWYTGNRGVTIYTDGALPGAVCVINQFDPS